MIITYEIALEDFEFWGVAYTNFNHLTNDEVNILEEYFSEVYPAINQTVLNDMFAYHFEEICAILNLDEDEVLARG